MVIKSGIAFLATCLLVVTPTLAQERPKGHPAASVTIQQIQVSFIGSGALGGGTLKYGGRSYPINVGGLDIGGIGASRLAASETVYGLSRREDFAGTYVQIRSGWALGDQGKGTLGCTTIRASPCACTRNARGCNCRWAPTAL